MKTTLECGVSIAVLAYAMPEFKPDRYLNYDISRAFDSGAPVSPFSFSYYILEAEDKLIMDRLKQKFGDKYFKNNTGDTVWYDAEGFAHVAEQKPTPKPDGKFNLRPYQLEAYERIMAMGNLKYGATITGRLPSGTGKTILP